MGLCLSRTQFWDWVVLVEVVVLVGLVEVVVLVVLVGMLEG